MITVYDEGSFKLDVDIFDILGIPNPTVEGRDPTLAGVKTLPTFEWSQMRLIWLWLKDNKVFVALICLSVLIVLSGLRKG